MIRTQIQFSESQLRALKEQARCEHVSVAEIVRRAVDACCQSDRPRSEAERRQAAMDIAGRFASGKSDVAERYDNHLTEAYKR